MLAEESLKVIQDALPLPYPTQPNLVLFPRVPQSDLFASPQHRPTTPSPLSGYLKTPSLYPPRFISPLPCEQGPKLSLAVPSMTWLSPRLSGLQEWLQGLELRPCSSSKFTSLCSRSNSNNSSTTWLPASPHIVWPDLEV